MRTQSLTTAVFRFQKAIVMSPVIRSAGESGIETMPVAPSRSKLWELVNFVAATVVDSLAPGEKVPLKPFPEESSTTVGAAASSAFQWARGPIGAPPRGAC